jgi:GrpB-like predicted nucleotidyltransferase (UPF0157 family)/8-oxo-dGTP pyrophosphatase MutT (NUDIX family)
LKLLQEHDAWASEFAQERQRIIEVLRPHILGIEHVGSTALPGIPAKPVLDIVIEVPSFEQASACIAPMEFLGYEHRGEHGIPRRHYFVKGNPRTHHVHMLEMGTEMWRNMLAFRDALLSRPALARQYANAKLRLAARHRDDRAAYQQTKDGEVDRILQTLSADAEPVEKVIAYITRGSRLLVFSQPDFPEAGIQAPGGSVELRESLPQAVLREAQEETGLDGLEVLRFLGTNFYFSPDGRILRRNYFHLTTSKAPPEQWEHWEDFQKGGEPSVRLRFWWVDVARVPKLAGGRGALLPMLSLTISTGLHLPECGVRPAERIAPVRRATSEGAITQDVPEGSY